MTQYILIGVRYGVLWRCYREPGESEESWQARADEMREAFEAQQRVFACYQERANTFQDGENHG